MDNQFVLRRAQISEINALSQLSERTIRETYIEDLSVPYPEKDLNSYLCSSASPEWFADKIVDPKQAVWVIDDKTNSELVAYAVTGPCNVDNIPHPDVCSNKDGAIYRLYVRRDRQGQGFGQQLMNAMLLWLEEHYPERPIWLTTYSQNFKAQNFYVRYGFSKVGDCDYAIGEWIDHEFIMKRQTNI